MAQPSVRAQQIVQVHAAFILLMVQGCADPSLTTQTDYALKKAEENGWRHLARITRLILGGRRDASLALGLDEEDAAIITAILQGIQNPETLPDPQAQADPNQAAPGIANLVLAAASQDLAALQAVAAMAEQMSQSGGDMAHFAAKIQPLIQGERDPDKLCEGMSDAGQQLMLSVLKQLSATAQV